MPPYEIDVAILCATPHEAQAMRRRQRGRVETVRCAGKNATLAQLGRLRSIVIATGLEAGRLEMVFDDLMLRFAPRLVVNFGAAGAIAPDLAIGDLTAPREAIAYAWPGLEQSGPAIAIDAAALVQDDFSIRLTRAGSCPQTLSNAEARERLRSGLGIDTTDYETQRAAALCRSRGVPFFALRCITDHADEALREDYSQAVAPALERGAVALDRLLQR